MRAGLIAARDERDTPVGNSPERGDGVAQAAQPGAVARRPDHEELVVHHEPPPHEVPRIDEQALGLGCVGEDDIGVSPAAHRERLPATHGDHLDAITGTPLENRQQRIEQPGVASGGGGGEDDDGGLGGNGRQRAARGGKENRRESEHRGPLPPSAALCRPLPPVPHQRTCI